MKQIIPFILVGLSLVACKPDVPQNSNQNNNSNTSTNSTTTTKVEVKSTLAQEGKSNNIEVGQKLRIELDANVTTGYTWKWTNKDSTNNLVKLIKEEYIADKPVMAGSGGTRVYTFEGVKKGKETLTFLHSRSWQKEDKYSTTKKFKIIVK